MYGTVKALGKTRVLLLFLPKILSAQKIALGKICSCAIFKMTFLFITAPLHKRQGGLTLADLYLSSVPVGATPVEPPFPAIPATKITFIYGEADGAGTAAPRWASSLGSLLQQAA